MADNTNTNTSVKLPPINMFGLSMPSQLTQSEYEAFLKAQDEAGLVPLLMINMIEKSEREHPLILPAIMRVMQSFDKAKMNQALVFDSMVMCDLVASFLQKCCPPRSIQKHVVKVDGVDHQQITVAILPSALPGIVPLGPPIPATSLKRPRVDPPPPPPPQKEDVVTVEKTA